MEKSSAKLRSTTVLAVRRDGLTVLAADGQVTQGNTVLKSRARKVRRLHHDRIVAGFAGGTADALALFERLEGKLQEYSGNLLRSAVELAKDWRTDRSLRRLEAMLLVADADRILLLTGNGDVAEPDDALMAIGSGGPYALAAAQALLRHSDMGAREIAEAAMDIAAELCIYTNAQRVIETLSSETPSSETPSSGTPSSSEAGA